MNKDVTIKRLTDLIMQQAEEKNWGTKSEDIDVAEKIALIHSEVSEAFEAYRHNNIDGKDGFAEELGDVVFRVLHLCGIMGVDVEDEILKKFEHNKERNWDWDKLNEKGGGSGSS